MAVATRGTESATVNADGLGRRRGALGKGRQSRVELKELAGALALAGGGRAEESVAADLLKAFWEDVLEKACDEGVNGKGEMSGLVCARADIAEGDAAVIEGFDAVVGESDTMDISGKVLGSVLAVASVLEVDVPGFAEDRRIDLPQEVCTVEGIADLGAEDLGQGVTRDEEAGMSGLAPDFALIGQSAGGGEKVDVGVVGKIARPGMEHRQDAELGADPLRIVGEVLEGRCGFAQEQVVDGALVGACEVTQLGGEGEGDEVVGAGQESAAQALEPELRGAIVTLRAVSVAARVIGVVEAITGVADEQGAAESRGPAVDDVRHCPFVGGQHAVAIGLPVDLPSAAEDLRQFDHGGDRWRSAALHQAIDGVSCGLADLPGQMGVNFGGAGTGVAEVLLDEAEVDAVLEQVGGIGVAQGVDVSAFVQTTPLHGVTEGALETVASDRSAVVSDGVLDTMASDGGKQPEGRMVGAPVAPQQLKSGGRQRNLTVLEALATDAKNAAGTVDVGDLKAGALHEAQATGINRGQADAVDVDAHGVEDAPDLVAAEHHGEFLFGARLGDIQALPIAAKRLLVEEAEAAEDDREGAAGDLLVELQMQQVASDLVFFELVGRPVGLPFVRSATTIGSFMM